MDTEMVYGRYWAIRGLVRGAWQILFAPYLTRESAMAACAAIAERNPQCQYQTIMIVVQR